LVDKRPKSKAVFVGAILRKEFDNLTWQPQGKHFVVYSCPMLEQSLAGINQIAQREQKRGKVFGVPASMVEGYDWLDHQPTSETGFLTGCLFCRLYRRNTREPIHGGDAPSRPPCADDANPEAV
jgi:hypothetical protein